VNKALAERAWALGSSEERDIDALLKWFPDKASVNVWGGPKFRFPFNRHSFAEDIHWGRMASFSLRDERDGLVAFGQVYERYERIHFARLVAHPDIRGRGVGKHLMAELMAVTPSMYDCNEFSLFVFRGNTPAYNCYLSMGFEVTDYPDDAPLADACFYLTRPVTGRQQNNNVTQGEDYDE